MRGFRLDYVLQSGNGLDGGTNGLFSFVVELGTYQGIVGDCFGNCLRLSERRVSNVDETRWSRLIS